MFAMTTSYLCVSVSPFPNVVGQLLLGTRCNRNLSAPKLFKEAFCCADLIA